MPTSVNYGAWSALPRAGTKFLEVFERAKGLARQQLKEDKEAEFQEQERTPQYDVEGGAPGLKASRPEAVKLAGQAALGGMHTLGSLGLVPPNDPRANLPVSGKQAPGLVVQGQVLGKPSTEAEKDISEGQNILGGVTSIGPLAQKLGEKYKASQNPLKGPLTDIKTKFSGAFPATAQQIDPDKAAYMQQARNVIDVIGRSRSGGAITESEWPTFQQMLPMEQDFAAGPQAVQGKLDTLLGQFRNRALARANSIANPVAKQQWVANIESQMNAAKQDLYKAYGLQQQQQPAQVDQNTAMMILQDWKANPQAMMNDPEAKAHLEAAKAAFPQLGW